MERNLHPDIRDRLPTKMGAQFDQLSGLVGDFLQHWGFKKIHGQIWLHIFLSDRPVDASTLVKRLKVSKALISGAIKDLLSHQVIEPCAKGHKRTIYFRSNPDIMSVVVRVLKSREQMMLDEIKESLRSVVEKKLEFVSAARLNELEEMIYSAGDLLEVLIAAGLAVTAVPKK
jgi:DNA-binding transcriptional regulator GbsR (MarR family)